jgi:hypothetical protein
MSLPQPAEADHIEHATLVFESTVGWAERSDAQQLG